MRDTKQLCLKHVIMSLTFVFVFWQLPAYKVSQAPIDLIN